jgi:hypothetical protein
VLLKKGDCVFLAVQGEQDINRIGLSVATHGYCLFRMGLASPAVGTREKGAKLGSKTQVSQHDIRA